MTRLTRAQLEEIVRDMRDEVAIARVLLDQAQEVERTLRAELAEARAAVRALEALIPREA